MRFFNKLERRFGRYAIHNLMYYIIIMYVMGFVMMYMDPMVLYPVPESGRGGHSSRTGLEAGDIFCFTRPH